MTGTLEKALLEHRVAELERRLKLLEDREFVRTQMGVPMLIHALTGLHLATDDEASLQVAVRERLKELWVPVREQVHLSKASRPDFFWEQPPLPTVMFDAVSPGVAIELKVKGGTPELIRQIDRYLELELVTGIVVVTTKRQHSRIPRELRGKPIGYVWAGVI